MNAGAEELKPPPRVFISYSHDTPKHCDHVLSLAQQLRRDGIASELDQFHQDELIHWPQWCEEQLRRENSKYVLCVCTAEYKRRIENRAPADVGKGVFWEGRLIYNYLYNDKEKSRFIPVLLEPVDQDPLPEILQGWNRYRLTSFRLSDGDPDYESMYRLLTGQQKVKPEPVGKIRTLLEKVSSYIGGAVQTLVPKEGRVSTKPTPSSLVVPDRKTDFMRIIADLRAKVGNIERQTVEIKSLAQEIKSDTSEMLAVFRDKASLPSTPKRPHNLPPWMPPEYFIGRDKELRELCDGLTAPGENALAVVQPQVVRGDGGIGKTRLAIQVVWVLYLQHRCDMAFVVSASSPAELDTQLAALDAPSLLDLYDREKPPRELDIRKQNVVAALRERAGHWILVLDAADSEKARDAVNELLNQLTGGRFLVTSRREDWPRSTVRKVPLDLFTIKEARACLLSRYWKSEPPVEEIADFDRVAAELGFLPLALVLAAGYMDSRRITPARYMDEWKEKHDTLLGFTAGDVEQGRSLLAAFKLSYDLLSLQAAHLLQMLAWLAPEPFPRRLVEDSEEMLYARIKGSAGGVPTMTLAELISATIEASAGGDPTKALAELRTLSLLQLDDESLRLHRLVLKCARATLPADARADACAIALEWISSILPAAEYDETNWKLWNRLSPHVNEVIAAANEFKIESEALAAICGKLGVWLLYQARHSQAEPMMRRALAIAEKSYGPEHPKVAIRLNYLAGLLKDTNRLEEAEPLMRRALVIGEKSYGPEHPEVAGSLNNLALLLKDTNRLKEAEPLMRRVVEIFEKSLGKDHPDVAIFLNNLAQLLHETNRREEAEPLMRRALAIDKKSYGPEHPRVASRLNNLAQLLKATNRREEAELLMRRALAINEKSYGPEHPRVATDLNNLALLLHETNRLEEAEPLMRRALAIDKKIYGPEHPRVATDLNNLALLLQDTNRRAEAEPLMRHHMIIFLKFTRSTGHLHPELKTALGNYRGILEAMSLSEEEIARRIAEVGKEAGLSEQSYHALLAELSK